MRLKVNLEWYALSYFNRKFEPINILKADIKEEIIKKMHKKEISNKAQLKEVIDKYLIYNYWSKSEFEIAVGSLFAKTIDELEKIDIYYQVKPNIDRIVDYINNAMELNLK